MKGKGEPIGPDSPLGSVRGVGEKTAALFAQAGLHTAGDLLRFYPRSYDRFEEVRPLSACSAGELCALRLAIRAGGTTMYARGRSVTRFYAADESGEIRLVYFNQPYLRKTLSAGIRRVFRGVLKQNRSGALYMDQPRIYKEEEYAALSGTLQPRYSLPKGLKNGRILRTLAEILKDTRGEAEFLPEEQRRRLGLREEERAAEAVHFPSSMEDAQAARERLAFDEFFFFLMGVYSARSRTQQMTNRRPMLETAEPERLIEALPYRLTDGQRQAWAEIRADLCGTHVMNRLLEGDVGSGKTILAFLALLLAASNGRQGAMMAPTEVLARQHMEGLLRMAERYHLPVSPVLLTGSVKGAARKTCYEGIASGAFNVVIGTNALIQEKLEYHDLGLVITDEQHRFGVRQREALAGKGEEVPILVMSATPIPRTLALILYGDLQVSLLKERPGDRLPIRNSVVDETWREKAYAFLLRQIKEGHQAYIICPAVGPGEMSGVANVEEYVPALEAALPGEVTVAGLHGRMKPAQKERIMHDFAERRIDILVSTTVVEVGINVPNATAMLVENAERFGLAQLHQLRGRVGRSAEQSYCIFMYSGALKEKPERLAILEHSQDGFYLAEEDMRLRGPGDLSGVRQSGELAFAAADIYADQALLKKAAELVREIMEEDPLLEREEHHEIRLQRGRRQEKFIDFRSI